MADHSHGAEHGAEHVAEHGAADHAHGPTTGTYLLVALILTVITAVEVWIFYVPAIADSAAFVPTLLILSAFKFFTVVAFYMHLKYDHKLFRRLFTGPFLIAIGTIIALLFLFGKVSL
jgi:cytochrome c oxidase subunit 4